MKKIFILGLISGLIGWSEISGQTVKVDGEIRTRSEYRNGFQKPLPDSIHPTVVSALRTRLNFLYSSEKMSAKVTLQDSHVYGSTGVSSTGNTVGVYEAWGSYAFTPALSVVVGRQSLEYDDKRMFSASNWSNTGQAHDLALLKYETKKFKAHLGTAYNNTSDDLSQSVYSVTSSYKYMTFAWVSRTFDDVNISGLWVNDGFQRGKTNDLLNELSIRNTVGANLDIKSKNSPVSAYLTGYYQFGHDAVFNSLNAFLLAFKAKIVVFQPLVVTLGTDYYSGSKYTITSGKNHTFNKLYGVSHSFNGSMEYWKTLPTQGLVDLFGGLTYSPTKKFNLDGTFHAFSLAQAVSATVTKKNIGQELDLTANYIVSPAFTLQGGWSGYFSTYQMKVLKKVTGDNHFPNWAYLMLTFKPKFL